MLGKNDCIKVEINGEFSIKNEEEWVENVEEETRTTPPNLSIWWL